MHSQDIRNIRKAILHKYPNWAERMAIMPDKQIFSVYAYLLKKQEIEPPLGTPGYRQMTLFDHEFINKMWGTNESNNQSAKSSISSGTNKKVSEQRREEVLQL